MTKTKAVIELRRVLQRVDRAFSLPTGCLDKANCHKRLSAKGRCVVCDVRHVLKYSERALTQEPFK